MILFPLFAAKYCVTKKFCKAENPAKNDRDWLYPCSLETEIFSDFLEFTILGKMYTNNSYVAFNTKFSHFWMCKKIKLKNKTRIATFAKKIELIQLTI